MKTAAAPLLEGQDPGVKEVALVPAGQPVPDASGLAQVVQQLAANPNVDVSKLEKIIELQERIMRINAKQAFDAAFAEMKPHLPQVIERSQIKVKDTVRSTYAALEDIDQVVTPIISKYGFAVRHRTEWPEGRFGTDGKTPIIRVVGILSHREGHSEESTFEAPMDRSDFRTDIQSMGSTISYGRRYTVLDLLNIVTRKADDDGASAGRPQPPSGYDSWWSMLESVAENGARALDEAWEQTKGPQGAEYKNFTVRHNKPAHEALKAKAAKVRR